MPWLNLHTLEVRVGVVGTSNSGKTVLLTSLINHLMNHDPDRFVLGDPQTRIRKFRELPPDRDWDAFNYPAHRDTLVNAGRWPEKTRDRFQYACRFERSDWRFSDCVLKLYDLPGERVADAAMLGRTFAEWSQLMLGRFQNDAAYRVRCEPFLRAVEQPDASEDELVRAYKLALANLILDYKPLISPSTFLLDVGGGLARGHDADQVAGSRFAGLDAARQFCPLPAAARDRQPELFRLFEARYDEYVREVVRPTISAFKSCTALVVLVDVTTLLAGGVGTYNDSREIVRDLFEVLSPGEHSLFGPLARGLSNLLLPHAWRPSWVTRVAFVAPKIDLVHPADRDKVLHLLRRLGEPIARDRDGLKYDFFNVSAVVSTRVLSKDHERPRVLEGVPLRDAEGRKVRPGPAQRYEVSIPPDDWPHDWPPLQYSFPEVYPRVPPRKDFPPDHINLDKVASFVIA